MNVRPRPADAEAQARRQRAMLDERTCRMICPVAAAMVGVCLTGIGLLRVVASVRGRETIADDLLSFDALLFLAATLASYIALRVQSHQRLHGLERIADAAFIAAMVLLTLACFVITYAISR
ncbi:hypothetical protein [uncultured Sphingomonas sp.]|uniref:hypothetical protein n=1 Tax=uncultured Sphingomonas sp. TaxID=158754 RepID=UPI0025F344C5|nr:hypothetical protein [uncultured Sphingomonas sp.]